jgi:hypothetical protein
MSRLPGTVLGTVRLHFRQWRELAHSVPLTTRLFCYSVCLEPFLFFLLFDRLTAGFSLTLARAFQVALYLTLVFRGVPARLPGPNRGFPGYPRAMALFIGAFGLVYLALYAAGSNYIFRTVSVDSDATNAFAGAFSAGAVRPFIEAFTLMLTVLHYFWLGPRLVRTREHLVFLVLTFVLLSYASLAVGFVNFGWATVFGQNLMPRHLAEFLYELPSYSGVRFQGLAGEPRDAFGQLVLFVMVLWSARHLGLLDFSRSAARRIGVLTALALVATSSGSGLVGVVLFGGLFVVYQTFSKPSLLRVAQGLAIALLAVAVSAAGLVFVERLATYVEVFSDIQPDGEISTLALSQFNNIYPLMHWMEMCLQGRVGLCALGGGFGTSFALNSAFYTDGFANPHSYVSRLLPELGVVGLVAIVLLLLLPAFRRLDLARMPMRTVKVGLLAVLAVWLAHKSNHLYLALFVVCLAVPHQIGQSPNVSTPGRRQSQPAP